MVVVVIAVILVVDVAVVIVVVVVIIIILKKRHTLTLALHQGSLESSFCLLQSEGEKVWYLYTAISIIIFSCQEQL